MSQKAIGNRLAEITNIFTRYFGNDGKPDNFTSYDDVIEAAKEFGHDDHGFELADMYDEYNELKAQY